MKRLTIVMVLVTAALISTAQSLKVLSPSLSGDFEYTLEESTVWEKAVDLLYKINSGDTSYENLPQKDKDLIDSLEQIIGPLTQGVGCSWYCGGGPYKVTSSSFLKEQGKANYLPDNLHDFNLLTAWAPDTKEGVTGKKVSFHFKPFSPRVNAVLIYNGYVKNRVLWEANARVKKLKLSIDRKPYAVLELQDVSDEQRFEIEPVGSRDSTKDMILTFEILEVYKGSKYNDVAISEINFDGMDVHCFAAGTRITMGDGSERNIELIQPGDLVWSVDAGSGNLVKREVSGLISAYHLEMVRLIFDSTSVVTTNDHPFFAAGKGWVSVDPEKSNRLYLQDEKVLQIQKGDRIVNPLSKGFSTLQAIAYMKGEQLTYTLELVAGENFIANGLLVKTEKVKDRKQSFGDLH